MIRTLRAAALVLALAAPAAAGAATPTITGDGGRPVPLTAPTTLRNMSPVLALTFGPSEKRYAVSISGPAGTPASTGKPCIPTSQFRPERVDYQGNGTYTATVTTTTSVSDASCAQGQTSTYQFEIVASAAIARPTGMLLTRRPGRTALIDYGFPVAHNPGAEFTEVRYARGVKPRADGSLPGATSGGPVPVEQEKGSLDFAAPGRYAIVVRPTTASGAGPWSPPVYATVRAPFDFAGEPAFTGNRIMGTVREKAAYGRKVEISLARGAKGGRFSTLRTVKINRKSGRLTFKLRLRRPGRYRLRYAFRGTKRIVKGTVTQKLQVRRIR